MPRYIDAEALMQKLCKQCGVKDKEYFCHAHCGDRMNIENMPTADVQPVKHGRWIPQGDDLWLCSNCKENIIYSMHKSDRTEKQRYCCRCGARMDGDIE